jgi:hypothetical protein
MHLSTFFWEGVCRFHQTHKRGPWHKKGKNHWYRGSGGASLTCMHQLHALSTEPPGGWVGTEAHMDALRREKSLVCPDVNSGQSILKRNHYTDRGVTSASVNYIIGMRGRHEVHPRAWGEKSLAYISLDGAILARNFTDSSAAVSFSRSILLCGNW